VIIEENKNRIRSDVIFKLSKPIEELDPHPKINGIYVKKIRDAIEKVQRKNKA
jgi:predicted glycosyltransferase